MLELCDTTFSMIADYSVCFFSFLFRFSLRALCFEAEQLFGRLYQKRSTLLTAFLCCSEAAFSVQLPNLIHEYFYPFSLSFFGRVLSYYIQCYKNGQKLAVKMSLLILFKIRIRPLP